MIIFLYGEDSYRRSQRKKFIINEFFKKNPNWGLDYFDMAKEEDKKRLSDFLSQTSLFGGKKLAVLENMDIKEGKKLLEENKNSMHSLLVSTEDKPTKETKFLLDEPVISEEFKYLSENEWQSFLSNEAKKAGIAMSSRAIKFFGNVYSKNTWGAVTELQKLSSLTKKTIDIDDLANLDIQSNPDFWLTLQRLKGKTLRERLWAYQTLALKNEPAAKTFNVVSSLWYEKSAKFADYDVAVKSGKLEYEEILLDAVIS